MRHDTKPRTEMTRVLQGKGTRTTVGQKIKRDSNKVRTSTTCTYKAGTPAPAGENKHRKKHRGNS